MAIRHRLSRPLVTLFILLAVAAIPLILLANSGQAIEVYSGTLSAYPYDHAAGYPTMAYLKGQSSVVTSSASRILEILSQEGAVAAPPAFVADSTSALQSWVDNSKASHLAIGKILASQTDLRDLLVQYYRLADDGTPITVQVQWRVSQSIITIQADANYVPIPIEITASGEYGDSFVVTVVPISDDTRGVVSWSRALPKKDSKLFFPGVVRITYNYCPCHTLHSDSPAQSPTPKTELPLE